MIRRIAPVAVLAIGALGLLPGGASAAPAPAWMLTLTPLPAVFNPGSTPEYVVSATNIGAAQTTGATATVEVTLPAGIKPLNVSAVANSDPTSSDPKCKIVGQSFVCETTETVHPDFALQALFGVEVPLSEAGKTIEAKASVKGGGANPLQTTAFAPVQSKPLPFGVEGFQAPLTEEDGEATLLAGSHPNQQTIEIGFPTESFSGALNGSGHPRDITIDLPRGMIANPAASPTLCTEAELISEFTPGCPASSQVGVLDLTTLIGKGGGGPGGGTILTTALYNMVPPPGSAAEVATNAGGVGIFIHFQGAVRSDSDYGIETFSKDLLAIGIHPVFGSQTQLWGDPSSKAYDLMRGNCLILGGECPADEEGKTAFLTTPGECPGEPPVFEAFADSWEEPGEFKGAEYESAELEGNPTAMEDCAALPFEPTIESRPTTPLTDSPSGLDFHLHLPQATELGTRSTAAIKDAALTLPAGMAVNPAQASGLDACTEAQIGFQEEGGETFFSREPQSCPAASKIGTVKVTSPPLVQRNEKHEVALDPETGKAKPEPLDGAIYLARPFANPFGTLVATYVVIEDEKTGIVAKLAGEGRLDPQSGQISVRFSENPDLPLEDIDAHVFGGSRGALITPPTCGQYTTNADFTPWSAPEGKAEHPSDSFQITEGAGNAPCPAGEAGMPNAPALKAGTLAPAAGKFSPLVFKLSREDGSQRMARIEATLPLGLSAKLAGVGQCSDADIAKAHAREAPNQGAAELADPSCPATSEVGTITAAAGAGPTPYYTTGKAYLAGPYKGAPLSVVAIVPAVAGPFDLGTVVVRSALYLDPETAQGRIVSDPFPRIIEGVPVDVRSVSVNVNRPEFTLNPTSCAEKFSNWLITSPLGQVAPLSARFQVGGCSSLPFKPKLSARLFGPTNRGAHPRLRVVLTAKPGEANIGRLTVTLPHSEFIDQAHFRTICTRVQYAANQCPAGSIYGHVTATTPLLGYPIEGSVFLRSSSHKLPDTVAALRGPAYQPIAIDGVARVDSVKGRLRATVETFPDAPITKVVLEMQGGSKGLFQNSTNICKGQHRVNVRFDGQNGKVHKITPELKAQCKGKGGGKKHKRGGHKRR
jgi:hypothetical protein